MAVDLVFFLSVNESNWHPPTLASRKVAKSFYNQHDKILLHSV